jgi:anaerobic selenocysteine-containing dehydrogenase
MNKKDMDRLGFIKDVRVIVKSKTGVMDNILARPFDIKRGAAVMYYPEVNSLISQDVDPLSQTPGFKSTLVTVQPFS